jgi:hypothetical protein
LGKSWFSRLIASLVEAGRTNSYVETTSPSQADSLHKSIKWIDTNLLKHEFEASVRNSFKHLRFGKVKVALDVTEEPYWGKNGVYNTRAKVHVKSQESWQYLSLSIVEPHFIPLMSLPYRQVDDLDDLVIDLLKYLRTLPLNVGLVLFDRGFYHANLIDYLENRRGKQSLPYLMLVPRTGAVKRYLASTKKFGRYNHEFKYTKDKSGWKPMTTIVICKGIGKTKRGNPIDWCFATNQRGNVSLVWKYKKRWNIETGFRIQDEAMIKSKSSHPLIRYFYHLVSMLIVLMWRIRNKLKQHIVFKRYLKCLEMHYIQAVDKPPPWVKIA